MSFLGAFRGDLEFCSNFSEHPVAVMIDDVRWEFRTNENFFQAMKSTDPKVWRMFQNIAPGESKKRGNHVQLRPDWDEVKDDIMLIGLRSKFMNPECRQLLLNTGDMELVEENNWGDIYWGKSNVTRYFKKHGRVINNGEGLNKLGQLLMFVRDEIRRNL